RIIGLQDPASKLPDDDPDDVGVDEAPDLRLALAETAVEIRIFERDGRLRGKQFKHHDSRGCENVRWQSVLEVEHTNELGVIDQGQAENGTSMALTDIGVRGKWRLGRGIVENGALAGSQHVVENRFRKHRRRYA